MLFDGLCNFCSGSVRFIFARDKKRRFRFAPLQSANASDLLRALGSRSEDPHTMVLIEGNHYHTKSSAALRIAGRLSGLWPLFSVLLLVPKPIRDYFYDAFAARRYRWGGNRDSCFAPTDDVRDRFLA